MATQLSNKFSEIKERYLSQFDLYENSINGLRDHPLHDLRKIAVDRLKQLDFPTVKEERWKYTNLTALLQPMYAEATPVQVEKSQVEAFTFDGLDAHLLVFVNGIFNAQLSSLEGLPEGVVISDMASALAEPELKALIHDCLSQPVKNETDPFAALNIAFAGHGVFIYVPANQIVEKPVHLLYITQVPDEEPIIMHPQSLVVAGQNAQLTLLESYQSTADKGGVYWTNTFNQIVVLANARVNHYRLQNEGEGGFQINNTTIYQDRDSTYTAFAADIGGQLVRNNLNTILKAPGTTTHMYGIYLANGKQHIDNHTIVDHAQPHCVSNELYKGLLTDRARGVFNGKVMVRQDAQKTNAFQQNSSLVLSKNAKMNTKPQLEIFADDVKCSHGATIGQLEEDAVFYLRTRGLTDEQARALLIHAFLKEVIDLVDLKPFSETIEGLVSRKLERQNLQEATALS